MVLISVVVLSVFASLGFCGTLEVGEQCDRNNVCASYMCNSLRVCTNGNLGDACQPGWTNDCKGGYTCIDNKCANRATIGGACSNKDECGFGQRCINKQCANRSGEGGVCESSSDCIERKDNNKVKCVNSKCTAIPMKDFGASCVDDYECNFFCTEEKVCYSGSTGGGCTQDYECTGKGGYCCVKTGRCGGPNSCI
ncbi:unnamed protein product [Cunninghamella echinulata]